MFTLRQGYGYRFNYIFENNNKNNTVWLTIDRERKTRTEFIMQAILKRLSDNSEIVIM